MNNTSQREKLNQATMRSAVDSYGVESELYTAEKIALAEINDEIRDKRILDIGVGGGRTVKGLTEFSKNYIGVDYVEGMVQACRHKFPGVRFETMDARSMKAFSDSSFELIVFTCNGVSMVDHESRIEILREVHRLLVPGGIFMFSTYNRKSAEHDSSFRLPKFEMTWNIAKLPRRVIGYCWRTGFGIFNRIRYKRYEISTPEYSIINDLCHEYRTMLYYITIDQQQKQLVQVGFKPNARVYNHEGRTIEHDDNDPGDSFLFVARR
jgi:SAM-dependent methyltransferase